MTLPEGLVPALLYAPYPSCVECTAGQVLPPECKRLGLVLRVDVNPPRFSGLILTLLRVVVYTAGQVQSSER
eukprot:1176480-Prorocentrum_minimum.AAC.4